MIKKAIGMAALSAVVMSGVAQAASRDYISIVGSSTVYPFATVVAETGSSTFHVDSRIFPAGLAIR